MHTTEDQCVREGLQISVHMLVVLSVFAGNALTTVGTGTPYQAVYGRQPFMLLPLEGEAVHTGDSNEGRVEARVQEITISMVRASSTARVSRTLIEDFKLNGWQISAWRFGRHPQGRRKERSRGKR